VHAMSCEPEQTEDTRLIVMLQLQHCNAAFLAKLVQSNADRMLGQ